MKTNVILFTVAALASACVATGQNAVLVCSSHTECLAGIFMESVGPEIIGDNTAFTYRPVCPRPGSETGPSLSTVWDRQDILHSPGRDALYMANVSAATTVTDGRISVLGSAYPPLIFVDGVKTRGSGAIPQAAAEQVTVMANGIPACWGDSYSGFVFISTRGALQ